MSKGAKIAITVIAIVLMWAIVIGAVLFLDRWRSTCDDAPHPHIEQSEQH